MKLKKKELELLKRKKELEEVLPHIYFPLYPWQRKIIDSAHRVNLLTAANQIGKSSALIRRLITNCTEPEKWKLFWGEGIIPKQFWYFYPDSATLQKEIETKWVPEWLPKKKFENDPKYGWHLRKKDGRYFALEFNAGPMVYFQTYAKRVTSIQAGSVSEVFCDEEMPINFYDEIMFRLTATNGIFTTGFTPTLNQDFWKQAMETNKVLPRALKMSISMYDCLQYEDGSPSRIMTLEKIKEAESKCKSETEKKRRVFGKFVTEEGRSYYAFDPDINLVDPYPISGWFIYAAVDYGSGKDIDAEARRKKNHPAAITFIAVKPDYKKGAIFKSWRGDNEKTTAGDVFLKFQDLSMGFNITQACYDAAAMDFGTIAQRNGLTFVKADKARESGVDLLNTLFKHKMLDVFNNDAENLKLVSELMTIMVSSQRGDSKHGDDLADAVRYACKMIPWDLSVVDEKIKQREERLIKPRPMTEEELQALQIRMRRGEVIPMEKSPESIGWDELESEFDMWNEEYG